MPDRIQRQRVRGWTMPDNTVYVGRPTLWGNPFLVLRDTAVAPLPAPMWAVYAFGRRLVRWDSKALATADAVDRYARFLTERPALRDLAVEKLAGKSLACWCPAGTPCHADVLLQVCNTAEAVR